MSTTPAPKTNGNSNLSGGVHYADMQMVFDRPALDGSKIKLPAESTRYLQLHLEWKLDSNTLKDLFGQGLHQQQFGAALQALAALEMPEPLREFLVNCSKPSDGAGAGGMDLGEWSLMVRYEKLVGTAHPGDPIHLTYNHATAEMNVDLRYRVALFANSTLKTRWDDILGALRHNSNFTTAKDYIKLSIGYSGKDDATCAIQLVDDLSD